jgi:hypothetical protein
MLYCSMEIEYTFYGRMIDRDLWAKLHYTLAQGRCPFCGKDDLKDNFGSKRKHVRSCSKAHGWQFQDQEYPLDQLWK